MTQRAFGLGSAAAPGVEDGPDDQTQRGTDHHRACEVRERVDHGADPRSEDDAQSRQRTPFGWPAALTVLRWHGLRLRPVTSGSRGAIQPPSTSGSVSTGPRRRNVDPRSLSWNAGAQANGETSAVELYWIPLGAGTPVVQFSGRVFEALSARRHHRARCSLYHAGLHVVAPTGRFVIEQTPTPDHHGTSRGVVAVGPVGTRIVGRFRVFRYEVRCWRDGTIPDLRFAVASPVTVSRDPAVAAAIIALLPSVPTFVWGRDEARAGEMWNSNSVISWVLTRAGADLDQLEPPPGGRAPGWAAGRTVGEQHLRRSGAAR